MIKIVVFDIGYGGELFADRLETEFPTAEIIRVISWRNAEKITNHPLGTRKIVEEALCPYLGSVDLIVIANYFISAFNLRYLRRKYKKQTFIGFTLRPSRIVAGKPLLILTERPTTRSIAYFSLRRYTASKTVCLDDWPRLIDDGELTQEKFTNDLMVATKQLGDFTPKQVFLASGQFTELMPQFREVFGHNTRMIDSFNETINSVYKNLNIKNPKKQH